MKATKVMIVGVCTFIFTWCVIALIGYLLSDDASYKECMRDVSTILIMSAIGWFPTLIVCNDIQDKLKD
jgi:hypothetical protein